MAVDSFDLITVQGQFVTVDLIIWQRYKIPAFGILEQTLDLNPHLSKLHRLSPFLPVGTQVRIPIDQEILKGRPKPQRTILLYGGEGIE